MEPTETIQPTGTDETSDLALSRRAEVKRWQGRIARAKTYWKDDFDRMRKCMEFVQGFQWKGQLRQHEDKYVANFLLRLIKQKVATLYAKDPKTEFIRRKRMDFSVWDEKVETLMQAIEEAQMAVMQGQPVPPQLTMLLDDYMAGKEWQDLVEKIGKTLEILYQYQIDTQEPEFKLQAKDAVDRACVCGVAYARVNYVTAEGAMNEGIAQSATYKSDYEQKQQAKQIIQQVDDGTIQMDSADVEVLRSFLTSIGNDIQAQGDEPPQRIVFDFPPATSIIPDPNCRRLKGFVGAEYIIEEYTLPKEFVKAFFELPEEYCSDLKDYQKDSDNVEPSAKTLRLEGEQDASQVSPKDAMVMVWEVFDYKTKSRFIVCDGYKDYLLLPEPHVLVGKMFWPIFALVFNAVETEAGCKASIFPPSDVTLGMHQQKEWNRTRDGLRGQRKANAPKYLYAKGQVEEKDVRRIVNGEANEVIGVTVPVGTDMTKLIAPLQVAAIDPAVYDTTSLKEDLLLSTGIQEANIGPAQPNVTATNSSIAEQSRSVVAASDVDTLDDWLSALAAYAGGLMMKFFTRQTVIMVVGRGAVWPDQSRDVFSNEIILQAVAGSSGRANKALEIANFQRIMPILQQAGANPQAIVREGIRILDANLDPTDFFPVPQPPQPVTAEQQVGAEQQAAQGQGQPNQSQPPGQNQTSASEGQGQMRPAPTANTANKPQAAV